MVIAESTVFEAKSQAYFIALLIIWISTLLLNLILTSIFKSSNTNWGKYWLVWFFTAVISGILLFFISSSPEQFINILDSIKGFFLGT